MKKIQMLYHRQAIALSDEMTAMRQAGFLVGTEPMHEADTIIYRGPTMWSQPDYPKIEKGIQTWESYSGTLFLSNYYPYIEEITIPTFFSDKLDESVIREIHRRKWNEVIIKNDVSAIIQHGEILSAWPQYSMECIEERFAALPQTSCYAIRKRIPMQLYEEERYWVLNNRAYHRSKIIPDIVNEAIERLKPIGSKYYVIDALPEMIVEVNPGESSDRYIDNSPELFAGWFRDAFL